LTRIKDHNQKLREQIEDKRKLVTQDTENLYSAKSELEVLKKQLEESNTFLLKGRKEKNSWKMRFNKLI